MRIHLYSIHGLFRAQNPEIGRDADNGGQIVYVMELARALSRSPDVEKVHLFTRLVDDPELSDDYARPVEVVNDKLDIRRIECGLPGYIMKEQLWPCLDEFVSNTIRCIKSEGIFPDWMHSHYADAAYVTSELSDYLNVPFAHSAHSLGKRKLKRLIESGLPRAEAMSRFSFDRRFEAEELALANSEFIVTSTDCEAGFFASYENSGMAIFHTLPPGVNVERFYPFYEDILPSTEKPESEKQARFSVFQRIENFLTEPHKPMIVTICRPEKTKNIAGLIEAFGSDPGLQAIANLVIFAGIRGDIDSMNPGQREVLTQILLLMDKYNLYGRLAIPKRHDIQNEVPEIYRLAARKEGVFVNASLAEQFGLTLLESIACGLPVVATHNGGPAEIIPKCGNGLLVDPRDTGAIRSAIKKLLVDKALWKKFSNDGITNVRKHYGWEAHVCRYVELVKNSLGTSARTSSRQIPRSQKTLMRLKSARNMLVCDIDGTLVDDRQDASKQTGLAELIELLNGRENSFVFAVATGRNLNLVQEVISKFGIPEPDLVISSVGSEIYYGLDREMFDKSWQRHIDVEWDRDVIELLATRISGLTLQEEHAQRSHKISLYLDEDNQTAETIAACLGEHERFVRVIVSQGKFVDLLPRRASKGSAIRYLCNLWDIPLNQTVVCGDSGNDLDMLQTSALGVVVGNAEEKLVSILEGTDDVYFAKRGFAAGVLEGINHFGIPRRSH